MWGAGRPPKCHGQCRHARGGCGHLLSSPAPLSACQGIKGLLAFVSGSPSPGSLHNKVLPQQIPSPLLSAAHGQGTRSLGVGVGQGSLTLYLGPEWQQSDESTCGITWEPASEQRGRGNLFGSRPSWRIGAYGSPRLFGHHTRQSLCCQEAGGQAGARWSPTPTLSLDFDGVSSLQPRCLEPCPGQLQPPWGLWYSDLPAQLRWGAKPQFWAMVG